MKSLFNGLALCGLILTSAPAAAQSASGSTVFAHIDLVANIETVGIAVSGLNLPKTAQLIYSKAGEKAWYAGHPLMLIADGRLIGSLFGLSPSTAYKIKVFNGSTQVNGSITTQPDELQFTPRAVVHVSASASSGGDGSVAKPFATIQAGLDHAGPGAQVLVADGVYHEEVTFPNSGMPGQWIQVKAQGSAAILDGSEKLSGNIWLPAGGGKKLYYTKLQASPGYLGRDGVRFYEYDDRQGLNQGFGHNDVPIDEGWYYDAGASKLYIRVLDDPTNHTWQMPYLNQAFNATGQSWLWIEGFEMRFYGTGSGGCGVCMLNASHVVIRKNNIHNIQLGVFINWNGSPEQGDDTRIEYNEISDSPVDSWPWKAVKGSSMEDSAIVVRGHIGAIVRGNRLHNLFNGIYTGSSAAVLNPDIAFDVDVYDNHITDIGDDALEPEGACVNQRFHNNIVDSVLDGVSLAPIAMGPVWVLRSLFTNFTGRAFKWDEYPNGIVLIYHNTSWSNVNDADAMEVLTPVQNSVLRNNIFRSRGYGVDEMAVGSTGNDWNNDDWYTTSPGPHFLWEKLTYPALVNFCAASGLECKGLEDPPGLTDPAGGDFSLLPTSPNIDRGVLIPGINDDYAGAAPDLGAFEYGLPIQP